MGWFVRCDHCRPFKTVIYGNNVRHLDHEEGADLGAVDWDALKQSAIDAWNRRAPNAPRAIGYMAAGRVQELLDGQAVTTTITAHKAFMDDAVIYAASAAKGA